MEFGDRPDSVRLGRGGQGLETSRPPTRALVIVPLLPASATQAGSSSALRDPEARLSEAVGLANAIDLEIVESGAVRIVRPRPATLLGTGKIDEIAGLVRSLDIGLVVVDAALSPVQQRNLERAWDTKVLDRTGLILEIFGRRARTREGTLQVELAHLNYQKSRLVRSWTHLERQRGGFGFLGGPGETQIEADRRLLQDRIGKIERELEQVRRTRGLHRSGRERVPYPVIALVGYTNAGKSTLFNRLTSAGVLAEDMLFATLDPTLRTLKLPHGREVILSDTVGFISDLPTHLIAAFRATLEEVVSADVILHVRDIADPDTEAQSADVTEILSELDVDPDSSRIIEVWNKADLLSEVDRERFTAVISRRAPDDAPILISAVTGQGIDALLDRAERLLSASAVEHHITVAPTDGSGLSWLYRNCDVLHRLDDPDSGEVTLDVRVPAAKTSEFDHRFGASAV